MVEGFVEELKEIIEDLNRYLQVQKLLGIKEYPVSDVPLASSNHNQFLPRQKLLAQLEKGLIGCQKCGLHLRRKNIVFGTGKGEAELVFIGEAPGEEEDLQGRPFIGLAGGLLTRIIESIGLRRDEVYIGNVVKCRPPKNRNPKPEEIAACEPYLIQQLEIIKPKLICALGTFAAQTLLKTDQPISRLRGRFHWYHNIKLMPTFHPAYLLRNQSGKKVVWQDMQLIKKELLSL
jgi:DNA polymerase